MSKLFSALKFCAAVVATLIISGVTYAQCTTCGGGGASFNYPGAACAACSGHTNTVGHQGGEVLKARLKQARAYNQKVAARSLAWPKPFQCGDRSVYGTYFQPMLHAGVSDQNTLSSIHFNEDGDLSRYGQQQIAGIMNNMPEKDRIVYLRKEGDEATTRNRMAKINQVVTTWYGKTGAVRLTDRNPVGEAGPKVEAITNNYLGALSAPVIPIADGNSSVADSVTQ